MSIALRMFCTRQRQQYFRSRELLNHIRAAEIRIEKKDVNGIAGMHKQLVADGDATHRFDPWSRITLILLGLL